MSNWCSGKRTMPVELRIWRSILCSGNAGRNISQQRSKYSNCPRVYSSSIGSSAAQRCENIERGTTWSWPRSSSITSGSVSSRKPRRCIPESILMCTGYSLMPRRAASAMRRRRNSMLYISGSRRLSKRVLKSSTIGLSTIMGIVIPSRRNCVPSSWTATARYAAPWVWRVLASSPAPAP